MDAIRLYRQQTPAPAATGSAQFAAGLFDDFIAWIDRSAATTRSYVINLRQFAAWLRFTGTENPSRADIILYRQFLAGEHEAIRLDPAAAAGWSYRTDPAGRPIKITCKPGTVAQYLRTVCQFFKWTAASGLYPDIAANIHAPKIQGGQHKKDALTASEVLQVERSIADQAAAKTQAAQEMQKDAAGRTQRSTEQGLRLYAMYLLAVNAGLRTIEISRANIRDLETKGGRTCLYIWGKGHSEPDQKKPLAPEVADAIRAYLRARSDRPTGASPLFVSTGNRSGGKRMATTTISRQLKGALQAAGFDSERITAHSLRHTAGNLVMQLTGNNIYETQQFMRHTNPATTEIYLHQDSEATDARIADQLYSLYHNTDSKREQLQQIIVGLDADKLARLADLAAGL